MSYIQMLARLTSIDFSSVQWIDEMAKVAAKSSKKSHDNLFRDFCLCENFNQ